MNAKDTIDIQVSFGMDLEADDVFVAIAWSRTKRRSM